MRRLILMRHAKSSWANPAQPDRLRPLKSRGRKDAERIGRHLRQARTLPDRLLVSPAKRARETADHLLRGLMGASRREAPEQRIEEGLYEFADDTRLRRAISRAGGDSDTLLVIGHNDALHDLALALAREGAREDLQRLADKFPTAAIAVIDLPIAEWFDLSDRTPGRLVHYVRPKDLR